jgi:LysM repeat protein
VVEKMVKNDLFSYYNDDVKPKTLFTSCFLIAVLVGSLFSPTIARSAGSGSVRADGVTAYDLIVAMNSLRVSNGLPALVEDSIIDAVASSTAQTMAANQMSWHIGNVSGRLASAGYGGGATVWATENFAVGNHQSIDEIMLVWSDASHMLPAVNAAYCNVGAGTAQAANGMTYYILQAAYTSGKSCGEYTSIGPTTPKTGGTTYTGVSQLIVPVKIASPDADGKVFHVVQAGQSFWAIAIAYKITIKDLKSWNNLSQDSILKTGQKLFIPGSNTAGYATPTQAGAIQISPPDDVGRVTHVVQSYQTLSTIAKAYGTTVDKILVLNGWQVDWPLQIGQKLIIHPSNLTPSPTLHPLQLLTPANDGMYYHIVRSGETLSWIAGHYGVSVSNLMAWNGLNNTSIIYANQKLLLQVTPPATATATPAPPTITPTVTDTPLVLTSTPDTANLTPTDVPAPAVQNASLLWGGVIFLLAAGLGLVFLFSRRNK